AGAAFHHGEPSCQLPHGKMLCGPGSTGVSVAPALGVLWFCLTGAAVEVQVPEDPVVALGAPLTDNVTTSQMANEQGLFDVHSVLRVVLGANGTYSCLVRNPVLQQDAHGSVTITGQPMTFPPEALWVTVGLSICLVILLVALAFVCWRKIKQSCEEENAGQVCSAPFTCLLHSQEQKVSDEGAEDHDGDGEGSKTGKSEPRGTLLAEDGGRDRGGDPKVWRGPIYLKV
ncbi:hypothetical protein Celaphus_00006546, partial [Cervus elaphus hippelaphus]